MTDDKPPQYTWNRGEKSSGMAAPEPASAPQPPVEDPLSRRRDAWREKFPSRAEALRRVVGPLLGYTPSSTLPAKIVDAFCKPTENKIVLAVFGYGEEER